MAYIVMAYTDMVDRRSPDLAQPTRSIQMVSHVFTHVHVHVYLILSTCIYVYARIHTCVCAHIYAQLRVHTASIYSSICLHPLHGHEYHNYIGHI